MPVAAGAAAAVTSPLDLPPPPPTACCPAVQSYAVAQGACGYGDLPDSGWPFGGIAAIDPSVSLFAAGTTQQGCGVCLQVQCTDAAACSSNNQPLVVLVTDHCVGCGAAAVYLAPSAYSKAVPGTQLGQVAGRFRRVRRALMPPPSPPLLRLLPMSALPLLTNA